MNLTGGQFKGHKIITPENTRPTLSKVRESVFNVLFQYFNNHGLFLDMFAGSGIMGLEAVSRGYEVVEVEINSKTANIIKENYKKIKVKPNIIIADSTKLKTELKFDIVYIDPPWEKDYSLILKSAKELIKDDGMLIIEYDTQKNTDFSSIYNLYDLDLIKEKKYGRTLISFVKLK